MSRPDLSLARANSDERRLKMRPLAWKRDAHGIHRRAWAVLTASVTLLTFVACSESLPTAEEIQKLQAAGRFEESIEPLRTLVDSGERSPEILFLYGRALLATGLWSQSIWALEEAKKDPEWYAASTLLLANGAYQAGNYDVAVDFLDELLEKEPENVQALRIRCRARLDTRRDYAGALGDAETVIDLDENSADMEPLRIVALLGLGLVEEAGEALEELAEAELQEREEGEQADPALASRLGIQGRYGPLMCTARAKYVEESGDPTRAGELYEGCFDRYPTSTMVIADAIHYHMAAGDDARVGEILQAAYEANPEERSTRLALARRLQLLGRSEEAQEILEEARAARYPGAWADLAGFLIDEGDLESGIEIYERARAAGVTDPGTTLAHAEVLLSADRIDEAEALAETISVEGYKAYLLGRVALKRGQAKEALSRLSEGTLLWPDNAILRYYTARAAELVGDFDRAVEEYRYVLRIDGAAADGRLRLARLHLAEGNPQAAILMLRHQSIRQEEVRTTNDLVTLELEALAQVGQSPPPPLVEIIAARNMRGEVVGAVARGVRASSGPEAVVQMIEAGAELDLAALDAWPALSEMTDALVELDRAEEALELARKAATRNPRSLRHRVTLGEALVGAGRAQEAVEAFDAALEQAPDDPAALVGRGRAALALGDTASALDYLSRIEVAEGTPEAADGLRAHAELLMAEGRAAQAEERLLELLEVAPIDGQAALLLGRLRLEQGASPEEVRSWADRAARFGAGDSASELLARLDAA
jgi:tetratricopeptide (TPR) repeat protein